MVVGVKPVDFAINKFDQEKSVVIAECNQTCNWDLLFLFLLVNKETFVTEKILPFTFH